MVTIDYSYSQVYGTLLVAGDSDAVLIVEFFTVTNLVGHLIVTDSVLGSNDNLYLLAKVVVATGGIQGNNDVGSSVEVIGSANKFVASMLITVGYINLNGHVASLVVGQYDASLGIVLNLLLAVANGIGNEVILADILVNSNGYNGIVTNGVVAFLVGSQRNLKCGSSGEAVGASGGSFTLAVGSINSNGVLFSLVVGQNDTGLGIIILILTIVDLVRYHGVFVTVLDVNHDLSLLTHGVGLLSRIKSYGQLSNNRLVTLLNIDPTIFRVLVSG